MPKTMLAPEPDLLLSRFGRERMLTALRRLYRAVEIAEPPSIDGPWIVIPAEPRVVYRALQRAAPDWFDLFVIPLGDGPLSAERGGVS